MEAGERAVDSNEDQPLVSIIVPCWNSEDTLLETLKSAAAQTYRNIEIIIVDDGSTDRSAAVAAEFCAREPRARVVHQENRGLGGARNRGIAESRGAWIAPIDADDIWHPTKIEKQIGVVNASAQELGLIYCFYRTIDAQSRVTGSGPQWVFNGAALQRLAYENVLHTVFSRATIEVVGGFDEALKSGEDTLMNLRIARYFPIAAVPEYLIGYRIRPERMWRSIDLVVESWRSVLQRVVAEGAEIPPHVLRWVEGQLHKVLAEERLGRRRYLVACKHMAIALGYDPVRWGSYVAYRLVRTVTRLVRGRRSKPQPLPFAGVETAVLIESDPDEVTFMAKLLRDLDARRLERLAKHERLDSPPAKRSAPAELIRSRFG